MATPILATKLYRPRPSPQRVPRPRLMERLNLGLARGPGLTVISAPAGFGKSTLVSEWLAASQPPAAWLSLDEGDSDPVRFLAYLIAALQTLAPELGTGILAALESAQPLPTESVLTTLLNEMTTLPDPCVLVLDDYHVINAPAVDQALTFLLEHLPPQLRLVLSTREDPQLPLARLRARGQLTELRAADLRFSAAEAAEFLNTGMGLGLAAPEVAVLEERTEGWIAGLQLAALSMQGRPDVAGFIQAFAGDHRYIVDYLAAEVLQRQPAALRHFLLQTAILDRLTGPLCDAVTGLADGSARLESLERGNFFVVALDDRRQWYRYHHLFAEVLRAHLRAEQPDEVFRLHQRASAWYEHNGTAAEAIRHALAAPDFERAADLIARAVPAMRQSRQEASVLSWLQALPEAVVQARPVLSFHYAWALLTSGQLEGVEGRLRDAERGLERTAGGYDGQAATSAAQGGVDVDDRRRLPGWIAVQRAGQAQARGDTAETVKFARQALDLLPEDDPLWRGAASSLLGLAAWASGDLEAAQRWYAEGLAHMQRAGHPSDAIGCAIALADIRLAQGRRQEARRTYEQARQAALAHAGPAPRGTADLYIGLSEICREQNDLPAATQHLLSSQAPGEMAGLPQNRYRWRLAMARLRLAQGDVEGALARLDEAEHWYVGDFLPNTRPLAAWKTRVWIAQGRLEEALGWAREQGLTVDDALSFLREFEHITLARVLLAEWQAEGSERSPQAALGLLERLRRAAEAGGRAASVIEIRALEALAHQAQGDWPAAREALEPALRLAEPEGYVRIFVDEGPAMAELMRRRQGEGGRRQHNNKTLPRMAYLDKLLAAFGGPADFQPDATGRQPTAFPIQPSRAAFSRQPLVEPLTGRELEVLRLLGTPLSGPEIARQLMVSLNTLRTHTQNTYTKLGVNDRAAAVRRAQELGLL